MKIPKTVKFRTFIVVMVALSLLLAVATQSVRTVYIGEESEHWLTAPTQEATYIIGQYNSTHYYAKNHTGFGYSELYGYEFLSTNASYVIQSAIDALTNGRTWYETVFLQGNFAINTAIELRNYTIITGGACLFNNVPYVQLARGMLNISHVQNVVVEGLRFEGNQKSGVQCTIFILNSQDVYIRRNIIHNATTGIYGNSWGALRLGRRYHYEGNRLLNCGGGVELHKGDSMNAFYVDDVFVVDNYVEFNAGAEGDTGFAWIGKGATIIGNTFKNGLAGIWMGAETWANQSIIKGNHFYDINYSGIVVANNTRFSTIEGNTFENCGSGDLGAIALNGNSSGNSIIGNTIKGGYGIYVQECSQATILGNIIQQANALVYSGSKGSSNIAIKGNIVKGCTKGLNLDTGVDEQASLYWEITDNTIYNCNQTGILLTRANCTSVKNNIIFNNSLASPGTYSGISLWRAYNNTITENKIFDNNNPKNQQYGIKEVGETNYNIIKNNDVTGSGNTGSILITASSDIVSHNIGFVTENSGTATCINGTWIVHGLDGTPTTVTLTINGSNYINSTCYLLAPTIIASNSTHFQIGFYIYNAGTITAVTSINQRDIMWMAEYKP